MTIILRRLDSGQDALRGLTPEAPQPVRHRGGLYRRGFKRLLDVMLVLLAIPFLLPLMVLLTYLVARDGGSPFYAQLRVGKGGRVFKMWKFRSMVVDADAKLASYLAENEEARKEWEVTQKLRRDPRITPFGRFMRKSSFDELPQLFNVLIGDMSLVGPRPMMVNQTDLYPATAYYELRPGITGEWQTGGRNDTTFAARAEFDTRYESNVTFRHDLHLLLRTVSVVFEGTGH